MTLPSLRKRTAVALTLILLMSSTTSSAGEQAEQGTNKIRVAVLNFENNTAWHYWGDNLGHAAADELVTQLFNTGEFSLVERTQLDAVLDEQDLGQSGFVNPSQAAEIGRLLGVQLILTGSITKFSIDRKGGRIGFLRAEYSEAETNLDVRLIDTNTAEIMFADSGEGKVRLGGISVKGVDFHQSFDAGLAAEALRPAVENVAEKIAAKSDTFASVQMPVAPAQVVGTGANGTFYIDKGANYGVDVGQRYQVHRVIDEIRDANGNLLDRITDTVGMLEVSRVLGQSSIVFLVEGEAAEGDTLQPAR